MKKLKSCPFCGSKKVNYYNGWRFGDREKDKSEWREPSVSCEQCGIGISVGTFNRMVPDDKAKEETIKGWNCRNETNNSLSEYHRY